jgi:hypothetical protein
VTVQDAANRQPAAAAQAALPEAARVMLVDLTGQPVQAGTYAVRAEVASSGKRASDSLRIVVPADEDALGRPILFRRGPATGPAYAATSDRRFRRADRLRFDVPSEAALETVTAVLLGRNGRPLAVPVTLGERHDNGTRYVTGEVVLAPLAVGDYLVEFTNRATPVPLSVLIAFRIVP